MFSSQLNEFVEFIVGGVRGREDGLPLCIFGESKLGKES